MSYPVPFLNLRETLLELEILTWKTQTQLGVKVHVQGSPLKAVSLEPLEQWFLISLVFDPNSSRGASSATHAFKHFT